MIGPTYEKKRLREVIIPIGISWLGFLIVSVLVFLGIFHAYSRGANDFNVFYEAWHLVLSGRGTEVYRVSPDRFLYAPGFAFILSPLGLLPKWIALAIWSLLKAWIIFFVIWTMSRSFLRSRLEDSIWVFGLSAWGVVWVARPLLIDLEYGQVNLLILGACFWGLMSHFNPRKFPFWLDLFRWCLLTFAAVGKLFPLPLLLVPWIVTDGISKRKLSAERWATLVSGLFVLLIPVLVVGWSGAYHLLLDWREAVLARGLPLESHNQSFSALLYHYLSGNPTRVMSEGTQPIFFGMSCLTQAQISLLSLFWTFFTSGMTLGWILSGKNQPYLKWISVVIGLVIVPSHLIWKPYFVMSLPLTIFMIHEVIRQRRWGSRVLCFLIFVVINLTGFDFVGHHWASHFEAASLLLIAHLVLIIWVAQMPETLKPVSSSDLSSSYPL